MYPTFQRQNSCNTIHLRNMVCFRYTIVNALKKSDKNYNNGNNRPYSVTEYEKLKDKISKFSRLRQAMSSKCTEDTIFEIYPLVITALEDRWIL
jgi:hypothetical protein